VVASFCEICLPGFFRSLRFVRHQIGSSLSFLIHSAEPPMAVFAPIPSASVKITMAVKPGLFENVRMP
jgi:hypothetical protein